jgi:hydrogenase expression/formation protein HypC
MCLGIPGRVVEVDLDGRRAQVSIDGRVVEALLVALDPDPGPVVAGDWLLVHCGLAVERLEAEEARDLSELTAAARTAGGHS